VRCYRIDEDVFEGIHLQATQKGLCIEVGDRQLPIDPRLSRDLMSTKERVISELKRALDQGAIGTKVLEERDVARLETVLEEVMPQSIELLHADIEQKNRIVKEKRRRPDALVLVETSAGEEGSIAFKSTTYDEIVDDTSGRVRRQYRDVFPPPGVTVLEEGKSRQGSRCFLLKMVPNAALRIERTGALEDAPSILTIVWKGRKGKNGQLPLLMFSPDRRQDP
jgi:hypothetical protein